MSEDESEYPLEARYQALETFVCHLARRLTPTIGERADLTMSARAEFLRDEPSTDRDHALETLLQVIEMG